MKPVRVAAGTARNHHDPVLIRTPEWMDQAACLGVEDWETFDAVFFGDDREGIQTAYKVCAKCPVRTECADYAIRHKNVEGVWGGMSHYERKGLACAS